MSLLLLSVFMACYRVNFIIHPQMLLTPVINWNGARVRKSFRPACIWVPKEFFDQIISRHLQSRFSWDFLYYPGWRFFYLMQSLFYLKIKILWTYSGADKSLAWPGRKQATETEDFWVSLYPIYNYNWRNISTIIHITRLASNEKFSPSNKINREVGRAKDLSALL